MGKRIIVIITVLILIGAFVLLLSLKGKHPSVNAPEPLPSSTIVAGPITVTLNMSAYSPSDTIVVTISNHSTQPISFTDRQTVCTVIRLERFVNQDWKAEIGCNRLAQNMRLYTLASGENMKVELSPPSNWPFPGNWPSGVYRAVLLYKTSNQSPTFTAISTAFQIH